MTYWRYTLKPEWIPSDIYRPISSKTAQLPTEPVKDGQPLSANKDQYTLIEQSATLIEQSKSFLKSVPKGPKKQEKKLSSLGNRTCSFQQSATCTILPHIHVSVASKGVLNVLQYI